MATTDDTQFVIELAESEIDEVRAPFKLQDLPEKEMQDYRMILKEAASTLELYANLVSVVHGTMSPGGPAASVILLDFGFIGSQSHGRRFRHARIDVGFSHINHVLGGPCDPELVCISPLYGKLLRRSTKDPGRFEVIIRGWEMAKSRDTGFVTLSGIKRIEGRRYGGRNQARWRIKENDNDRDGIPSLLRVAILVQPQDNKGFRATVNIKVKTDLLHGATMAIKKLCGKTIMEPVHFNGIEPRQSLNPEMLGELDLESLANADLDKFVMIGSSTL